MAAPALIFYQKFSLSFSLYRLHSRIQQCTQQKEDEDMVIYKTLADVPSYYKSAVQKAVNKGALNETGDGISVSEDLCRTLTVLDRLGKLD